MNVTVNGVPIALPEGSTLLDAMQAKEIVPKGIATAVNDTVIPAVRRGDVVLNEGDKIVIIKAFYGG